MAITSETSKSTFTLPPRPLPVKEVAICAGLFLFDELPASERTSELEWGIAAGLSWVGLRIGMGWAGRIYVPRAP
jgi:hypothetical protein